MSRSFRHKPIMGRGGESDKRDKRLANRALRRLVKEALSDGREILPIPREVADVWNWSKDGKRYGWSFLVESFPWRLWGK